MPDEETPTPQPNDEQPESVAPEGSAGEAPPAGSEPVEDADEVVEQALSAVQEAVDAAESGVAGSAGSGEARPFPIPDLAGGGPYGASTEKISLLSDVNLNVKIELGRTRMLLEDVLRLAEGAVIELDKLAGDPVDVYVNERHVARGEILVLNDNFCVRLSEVLDPNAVPTPRKAVG